MKKTISIILFTLISISSIFSEPTIKGDFSLYSLLNINKDFDYLFNSASEINLFLNSSSNNVKYTIKESIYYDNGKNLVQDLEQAYLKFRIPYNDSFIVFNFGKTPLDIGGDWYFNSGTPFDTYSNYSSLSLTSLPEINNPWIASINTKLYENDNFERLNLELIAKLPVEDSDKKIGGRLYYDINNAKFGTIETSFLTNSSKSIISGGLNGTLFFDFGLYAKTDLQNLNNFEISLYLLKILENYTFKFEAMYNNNEKIFILLPTFSYNITSKSNIQINATSAYNNSSWTIVPTLSLNQNIVQGLDFILAYSYLNQNGHNLLFSVTHKF